MVDPRARGRWGEDYAAEVLQNCGYTILARNFHSRAGEIDLIASDREYIAFIEVKTRQEGAQVPPGEAVTPAKQRKIVRTAYAYLIKNESDLSPRFDVIEVYFNNKTDLKPQKLTHIKSAFEPDGRDDYSLL